MVPHSPERIALAERAVGRAVFALLSDGRFDDWLLTDALVFTDYGISRVLDLWFSGRFHDVCEDAEVADLRDAIPYPDIQAAQELAFRSTWTLLQSLCEEVDPPKTTLPGIQGDADETTL